MEIRKNLKGEELKKLFSFFNEKADKISIERYCDERIPQGDFDRASKEFIDHVKEEDLIRRRTYESDKKYKMDLDSIVGIKNNSDADEYFNSILQQEMELVDDFTNDGEEREISVIKKDVIEKKYTRITTTTQGPLMQLYYLSIGELLKHIESELENLFDFPYKINGEEYENLAFYYNGKPIFCICSHEEYADINLDKEDKVEFDKLGIKTLNDSERE